MKAIAGFQALRSMKPKPKVSTLLQMIESLRRLAIDSNLSNYLVGGIREWSPKYQPFLPF